MRFILNVLKWIVASKVFPLLVFISSYALLLLLFDISSEDDVDLKVLTSLLIAFVIAFFSISIQNIFD